MIKTDIANRKDVSLLVHTFYGKVRLDPEIGDFFNNTITDWPAHMERLVDFWETNLFFEPLYKGNPLVKHVELDKKVGYAIENYHFGIWLQYWIETLDAHFEGPNAEKAKQRARNISVRMFMAIFEQKQPLGDPS